MAFFLVILLAVADARAEAASREEVQRASAEYEAGLRAHESGDHDAAVIHFARADELVPDTVALRAALGAALKADKPVRAMQLVDRADSRMFQDAKLMVLADQVRTRFAKRTGHITVRCRTCTLRIDGEIRQPNRGHWVTVGGHELRMTQNGSEVVRRVSISSSQKISLSTFDEPPAHERSTPAPETASGTSQAWFWVLCAATAAVTSATVVSAFDTARNYDAFVASPTHDLADRGSSAELRTNVLIGASAATAVVTGIVGITVVDWSAPSATATATLLIPF